MNLGWLREWVRRAPLGRGRWMTTLGAFLLLQAVPVLLVGPFATSARRATILLLSIALGLTGAMLLGVGLPLAAHTRRVLRYRQRYLLRLQDAKAWFVEKRMDEATFDAYRARLDEAVTGRFPGELRWSVGDVTLRTGLVVAATAAALATALVTGLAREVGNPSAYAFTLGAIAILGLGLAAVGVPLRREGKKASRDHMMMLDDEERALLLNARTAR